MTKRVKNTLNKKITKILYKMHSQKATLEIQWKAALESNIRYKIR